MPLYEYICDGEDCCSHCVQGFEVLQKIADPVLRHCTWCGCAVRRKISAPNIASYGDQNLNPDNLGKKGFTQYRKVGKGRYEKTAGSGPESIVDDGK